MKYVMMMTLALLMGCTGLGTTNTTYSRNEVGTESTVEYGVIVAIDPVTVEEEDTGVGTLAGAGLGAVAGSMLGGGTRSNLAGGIVGGLAGGIAGRQTEKAIMKGTSYRFMVEKDNGKTVSIIQSNEKNFNIGDNVLIIKGKQTRLEFDKR
ncbi:MAG: Outer membrane lipoprotein pcp precursor [Alphaproteobacteria bacterium ADurb.Bin438]|nr:MAG: Outer membrane lipoprotein pcp precursor [Alphaproteobacteria bacterium ADurb.Bin438]